MNLYWNDPNYNKIYMFDNTNFKKCKNILYSNKYQLEFKDEFYFCKKNGDITKYLKNDFKRIEISLCENNFNIQSQPSYIMLIIGCDLTKIFFTPLCIKNDKYIWTFNNGYIYCINICKYLIVKDNNIILSKSKQKWSIINNTLFNLKTKTFLTCDINYNIYPTPNKNDAIKLEIIDGLLCYVKPKIRIDYEINNILLQNKKSIDLILKLVPSNNNINIALLLAGGTSTRFKTSSKQNVPKQLFIIDGKTVIEHCVEKFINTVDIIVIIVNSSCENNVKNALSKYKNNKKIYYVKNDINCRFMSIEKGLDFIETKFHNKKIDNVILHDSARCFISEKHVVTLLDLMDTYLYTQYYFPLLNGLHKLEDNDHENYDRDKFVETLTPKCINYKLFKFIFNSYVSEKNRITYKMINIVHLMKLPYKLVYGHYNDLKKITTIDEIQK